VTGLKNVSLGYKISVVDCFEWSSDQNSKSQTVFIYWGYNWFNISGIEPI